MSAEIFWALPTIAEPLENLVLRPLGDADTRGVGIVEDAKPWHYFEPGPHYTLAAVSFRL